MKEDCSTEYMLKQVIDAGLCASCGACVNLCPYYASDNDRIVVLDRCTITDGACMDICPKLPSDTEALRNLLYPEGDIIPEIGAVKAFYITRAVDEKIRRNAQHGGTVTALVKLALAEGLIDTAVLSGAEDPMLPVPVAIATFDKADQSSKSRFVVTPNLAKFNEVVKEKAKSIGVVATPCQAIAVAKMKKSKHPRIKENAGKVQVVIGLFCSWAFSSSALRDLLSERVELDSIVGMDIPPSKYHMLEVYTPDNTVTVSLDEVQSCVRPSCRSCPDMTAEFSDISVGSARLPEGWEEAKSWNQMIVRTEAGLRLVALARQKGVLEFRDMPEGNLDRLKRASLGKKKAAEKK